MVKWTDDRLIVFILILINEKFSVLLFFDNIILKMTENSQQFLFEEAAKLYRGGNYLDCLSLLN